MSSIGGLVDSVGADTPAERAGVAPGDVILALDGAPLRDIIQWMWGACGSDATVTLRRSLEGFVRTHEVKLSRDPGEPWGIGFSSAIFDSVFTCENYCTFCFVAQNPPGLRAALYLRDDDWRLSFLDGNFITLTALSQKDVARIVECRVSPLYVSLHAVTPEVRTQLIRPRGHVDACATFETLDRAGIDTHVQIVAVPGVNDDTELDVTLEWLASRERVQSVGVVPLGYTRHQSLFSSSYEDPRRALAMIEHVERWQEKCRARDGRTWVHLADEFYLNALQNLPSADRYDDFPQLENGIGMTRSFLDAAEVHRHELAGAVRDLPGSFDTVLLTGKLFAPVLAGIIESVGASSRVQVRAVENTLFGGNVGVTGLLGGCDIARALTERAPSTARYIVPDSIFNHDSLTLDEMSAAGVRAAAPDAVVVFCRSDLDGLVSALNDVRA